MFKIIIKYSESARWNSSSVDSMQSSKRAFWNALVPTAHCPPHSTTSPSQPTVPRVVARDREADGHVAGDVGPGQSVLAPRCRVWYGHHGWQAVLP